MIASLEGSASPWRGNFCQALEPSKELREGPVCGAEQVTFAVPSFLHRDAKTLRRIARIDKAHAASRHCADLARHEVENEFG